jgi:hypothetical protein
MMPHVKGDIPEDRNLRNIHATNSTRVKADFLLLLYNID